MSNVELLSVEIKDLLDKVENKNCAEYVNGLYTLMCAYESEGNVESAVEIAHTLLERYAGNDKYVEDKMARTSYDVLARSGDFEAYCIALEWNRPLRKQFYLPRARLLKYHGVIEAFQMLQDDKLDLLVLNLPPRIGKQLSDETPILTRNGWKKHGDLVVGDYVLNDKGRFVRVLALSEKCDTEYEVTFSNGEKIECHGNHEWGVYDRHAGRDKVVETRYMIDKLRDNYGGCHNHSHNHYRFLIENREPVMGEYKELPVAPYALGAWLGDGTNKKPCLTNDKKDFSIAEKLEKDGYKIHKIYIHPTDGTYQIYFNGLNKDLQKVGMCHSRERCEKHIPEVYFTASLKQRLELLAGLLDTDGTLARKENRYSFSTTDERLKDDFITLVSTFGWRCSVCKSPPSSHDNFHGKKDCYRIGFNPTFEIPCQLERKKLSTFSKQRRISVVDIQPVEEPKKGRCIQVEGGIYLAGKTLVPTHNSTLSLFFLTFRAGMYPEQSILGNGHSTALTQSFYKEFIDIVTSDEYRFKEIFPSITLAVKNAEYTFLDFNREKRFHTCTFKSIEGGTTGLVEASNLLYCDDLVKDVETANSKDRLDKLYYNYTSTVKDRKVPRLCKDGVYRPCPELHVNTPWSIYDVTSRIVRTEIEKGNNERMRVVSVPCWDENRVSNFMYDYGKGFDTAYYEDMMIAEDPVIFSAKYLMKPIERDGHPFEKDALTYYSELPVGTPDVVLAYNDVSHGGEDFMSMPIAYVYDHDVFIEDVLFIHNFDGDSVSRPLVCNKLIEHGVTRCGFEKNNGGDFYSTLISQDLRARQYRCNITAHNAPTSRSKLDRILSYQNEIKGMVGAEGTYRVYFKDPKLVKKSSEYMAFLENIWMWSQKEGAIQKRQHDDGPDSVASMLMNMLNSNKGGVKLYDIREAGY